MGLLDLGDADHRVVDAEPERGQDLDHLGVRLGRLDDQGLFFPGVLDCLEPLQGLQGVGDRERDPSADSA